MRSACRQRRENQRRQQNQQERQQRDGHADIENDGPETLSGGQNARPVSEPYLFAQADNQNYCGDHEGIYNHAVQRVHEVLQGIFHKMGREFFGIGDDVRPNPVPQEGRHDATPEISQGVQTDTPAQPSRARVDIRQQEAEHGRIEKLKQVAVEQSEQDAGEQDRHRVSPAAPARPFRER